ncbi:hypothetical protein GCM10010399_26310 [Dactylosporangium fulvum]|uniref:Uncharacterized protein n=1 Tax=Dactylosporangium fulvum TaxID=53359 RepID=A0ABY5WBI9_9ACTN|nr:hypothetical protein [Dactylosporangium fulvum]UWP86892.1 hypothetical protein Dfulv_22670 [Dactylosporangium fulvum]
MVRLDQARGGQGGDTDRHQHQRHDPDGDAGVLVLVTIQPRDHLYDLPRHPGVTLAGTTARPTGPV